MRMLCVHVTFDSRFPIFNFAMYVRFSKQKQASEESLEEIPFTYLYHTYVYIYMYKYICTYTYISEFIQILSISLTQAAQKSNWMFGLLGDLQSKSIREWSKD